MLFGLRGYVVVKLEQLTKKMTKNKSRKQQRCFEERCSKNPGQTEEQMKTSSKKFQNSGGTS